MFIEYTPEERQQIEEIKARYAPELKKAIQNEYRDYFTVTQKLQDEIDHFNDICQQKRFIEIEKGGPAAVLKHAKEQAPLVLRFVYDFETEDKKEVNAQIFPGMGLRKNGKLYLYANYATDLLHDELCLHFRSLQNSPELIKELELYIKELIAKTDFIDRSAPDRNEVPGQMSIFDLPTPATEQPGPQKSPLKVAEDLGAVTTLNSTITFISNRNYRHAFTSKPNKYAYMINGGAELLQDIIQNSLQPEDGLLDVTEDNKKELKASAKEKPVDELLVAAFYSAVRAAAADFPGQDPRDPSNRYTRIYLPKFCRELGIRLNSLDADTAEVMKITIYQDGEDSGPKEAEIIDTAKNNNDFWARFNEVKNYIGVLESNGYVRFVNIAGYDIKTQILYLDFPYFNFLNDAMQADPGRAVTSKRDKEKLLYEKNYTNELIHSSVASARNKAGAAIAKILIDGVLQRGGTADAKLPHNRKKNYPQGAPELQTVTYSTSCAAIVDDIPAFKYRLEHMKSTDKARDGKTTRAKTRSEQEKSILTQQNKALKDAFTAAYKILETQTDLKKYYKEVHFTTPIPTMRTLKTTEIVITHKGTNPKYKKMQ